jgi:Tol biopolymer transport system component
MTPEQWEEVGRIFDAAAALRPEERSSFLDQACGENKAFRREVQALLETEDRAGDFLKGAAMDDVAEVLAKNEPLSLAGKSLGHYELLSLIGTGGMGEVYRAHDVALKREVAVKVLPSSFSQNADRLRRFKQEARAASALNHPNIVTIHEIGEIDSCHFIVSEYIEGETLRQRLMRGRMDFDDVIDVTTQIASGLAAAHTVGVIHRDIKPENVMLRPDGYVKILDFGLAKLSERLDTDPSMVARLKTKTGAVMGTSRYMSPEQARGFAVDGRSDVWSLGVVIYEMVTGRAPFEGDTDSDVLVSILEREPTTLEPSLAGQSRELEKIIKKALRKDREARYQTAAELLTDLKSVRLGHGSWSTAKRLGLLAATLALIVSGLLWFYASRQPAKSALPPMRIVPFTSFPGWEGNPAFSPDGNQIAFDWGGEKGDNSDIYVMLIGSEKPLRLTTDPGADTEPKWSPDGRQIAFIRATESDFAIYTVPALGGSERKLLSLGAKADWGPSSPDLDWSPDGRYIACVEKRSGLDPPNIFLFSPETGERRRLTSPLATSYGDYFPAFSPDSHTLAFSRYSKGLSQDLYLVSVTGGEPRRLTFDNTLLFGSVWSADGREIIFSSTREGGDYGLWRISASGGTPERLAVGVHYVPVASISRRGNRLAYVQWTGDWNIYRIDVSDSTRSTSPPIKLTSSTRLDSNPQYSPDGKRIVFQSDRSGSNEIWMSNSDGSNPVEVTSLNKWAGRPRWSPDGRHIAFELQVEANIDIYVISAEGGPPRPVVTDDSLDGLPNWSADGRWIYFVSDRTGEPQVWKVPAKGGEAIQVTKHRGNLAFESPDGRYVYYVKFSAPGIWRVPVDGGDEVEVLDSFDQSLNGDWAVVNDGIYFINPAAKDGVAIEFLDFRTRKVKQVAALGKVSILDWALAVSPDRRQFLYAQNDNPGGDIMLVENFR